MLERFTRSFPLRPLLLSGLLLLGVTLSPAPASGNGKFPAAGQIVVDPGDTHHVVVRTTFGMLISRDGGAHFDWICESGAGYGGNNDPGIAVTGDGSILAGVVDGLSVTHGDACTWAPAGGGLANRPVADVSVLTTQPSTAVALRIGELTNAVWISTDSAVHWNPAGVDLPGDFSGVTLDIAASDPSRLYVTGFHTGADGYRGSLARSKDGGTTWEVLDFPSSVGSVAPFLAAVDPKNADVIYARINAAPGSLLVSKDGGTSWSTVFTTTGFLDGFALSPDGATILAGGPTDGVFRAPSTTLAFTKVSKESVTCLAWSGDRVYACSNSFAVGLSTDEGATFTSLLTLDCIRGPLECDPMTTTVGAHCPNEWPSLVNALGVEDCTPDGGVSMGTGASTGAGGSASPPSEDGGVRDGGAEGKVTSGPGGCGCHMGIKDDSAYSVIILLAAMRRLLGRRSQERARTLGLRKGLAPLVPAKGSRPWSQQRARALSPH